MKKQLLGCIALLLGACPSVTVDSNEGAAQPTIEFDPAHKIIPFPNNLLIDPATGKVNLPEQCNESPSSKATRVGVLNKLDGFGTYEPAISVTFTEPVDLASLTGHVLLYQRVKGGTAQDPLTALPIPVVPIAGKTVRYTDQSTITACTGPTMVDQVTFIPTRPLEQKSTYTVALLSGIKTANGADFQPSFTWSLIREPEPVVEIDDAGNVVTNRTPLNPLVAEDKAQLEGIALLWNAHHSAMSFLAGTNHASTNVVLAFEFNTQTTTNPLDPAVAGSPASNKVPLPLLGTSTQVSAAVTNRLSVFAQCAADDPIPDTQCYLRVVLGQGNYAIGKATCAAAGCAAIGDVLGGLLVSKQFLTDVPNTGYTGTGMQPVPGAWNDPVAPTVVHDVSATAPIAGDPQTKIGVLVLLPQGAAPSTGWPVVIFQHGITRARTDVFGVIGGLAAKGFAVVSIDAVNHGSRAVRISNDAAKGCGDVSTGLSVRTDLGPDPTTHSDCYAPAFSSDLAATRDQFRQTVLDLQQLVTSLKACGTTACGSLKVDPTKILYFGHSMIGGNLGAMTVSTTDVKASVLNGAGAGWFDILEQTGQVAKFQCPLVDALIDAGVLTGDKYNATANTGLCLTDTWKTSLGYRTFAAIGRWILDPADPANFGARLGLKKLLLQEIDQDNVVPNVATNNLGAVSGRIRGDASCGVPIGSPTPSIVPSTALLAAPTGSAFLDYVSYAPGNPACPPGNTFGHGSLLQPEPSVLGQSCNTTTGVGCDGLFATVRLQTDAIYFLLSNQ